MNGQRVRCEERAVVVPAFACRLRGDLTLPRSASGLVLVVGEAGRQSPRSRAIGRVLTGVGLATLLIDLASPGELAPDLELLVGRLLGVLDWTARDPDTRRLERGLLGSGAGAAVALEACARRPGSVTALVTRGGRVGLVDRAHLGCIRIPALLIVASTDATSVRENREARDALGSREKRLETIHAASRLFEEPGALESVALLAASWFAGRLGRFARAARVSATRA